MSHNREVAPYTDKPRRAKISHDPRNTNWSRSTTTFGHKILTAQGWTPGSFLGAQDAAHAEFHTEANASHIRVAMKDDNLGVGARGSKQPEGECVGLDAFQGLLGRLNGKSDEVLEREQDSRNDVKRVLYTDRRWGAMHFVSGGLLVGDKIQTISSSKSVKPEKSSCHQSTQISTEPTDEEAEAKFVCKNSKKKRKLEKQSGNETHKIGFSRVAKLGENQDPLDMDDDKPSLAKVVLSERKPKKKKHHKQADSTMPAEDEAVVIANSPTNPEPLSQDKLERAKRKAERQKRREQKRLRKEKRVARVEGGHSALSTQPISEVVESDTGWSVAVSMAEEQVIAVPAPSLILAGRHLVRQRYIQHKKMAVMDPRALNEV